MFKLPKLKCEHKNRKGEICAHEWTPRVEQPKTCPKCSMPLKTLFNIKEAEK